MIFKKKLNKNKLLSKFYNNDGLIYMNNHIDIVSSACKVCYGTKGYTTYDEQCDYIRRRISSGHESVIEHSNIVMMFKIPKTNYEDVLQFLSTARYLRTKVRFDKKYIYLLIGGSIRGYKELFRDIHDLTNIVLSKIRSELYIYVNKCYFSDFIKDELMDESKFGYYYPEENSEYSTHSVPLKDKSWDDRLTIVNMDDIQTIAKKMYNVFTIDDLLDMITITVIFDKMSRVITQQLTRHRNAITQESGRYVKLDKRGFNSPEKYKDKYNDKLVNIDLTNDKNISLQDLGDKLLSVYHNLIEQELDKEDARGYLPQNYSSGKLYMTFTGRSMLKFLHLRTHPAAQAEIRAYAQQLYDSLEDFFKNNFSEDFYKHLDPIYKNTRVDLSYKDIDSKISNIISEDIVEITPTNMNVNQINYDIIDNQKKVKSQDI